MASHPFHRWQRSREMSWPQSSQVPASPDYGVAATPTSASQAPRFRDPNAPDYRLLLNSKCVYERRLPNGSYITAHVQRLQSGYYDTPSIHEDSINDVRFVAIAFVFHPVETRYRFKSAKIKIAVHCPDEDRPPDNVIPLPPQINHPVNDQRPSPNIPKRRKPRFLRHAPHLLYGALSPETLDWNFNLAGSLGVSQGPANASIKPSYGRKSSYKVYEMMKVQGSVRTLSSWFGHEYDVEDGEIVWTLEENALQKSGLPREFTFVMLLTKGESDLKCDFDISIEPVVASWYGQYPQWYINTLPFRPLAKDRIDLDIDIGQKFEPAEPGKGFNFAQLMTTFDDFVNLPGTTYSTNEPTSGNTQPTASPTTSKTPATNSQPQPQGQSQTQTQSQPQPQNGAVQPVKTSVSETGSMRLDVYHHSSPSTAKLITQSNSTSVIPHRNRYSISNPLSRQETLEHAAQAGLVATSHNQTTTSKIVNRKSDAADYPYPEIEKQPSSLTPIKHARRVSLTNKATGPGPTHSSSNQSSDPVTPPPHLQSQLSDGPAKSHSLRRSRSRRGLKEYSALQKAAARGTSAGNTLFSRSSKQDNAGTSQSYDSDDGPENRSVSDTVDSTERTATTDNNHEETKPIHNFVTISPLADRVARRSLSTKTRTIDDSQDMNHLAIPNTTIRVPTTGVSYTITQRDSPPQRNHRRQPTSTTITTITSKQEPHSTITEITDKPAPRYLNGRRQDQRDRFSNPNPITTTLTTTEDQPSSNNTNFSNKDRDSGISITNASSISSNNKINSPEPIKENNNFSIGHDSNGNGSRNSNSNIPQSYYDYTSDEASSNDNKK